MTRRAVTVEATVDEYLAWFQLERGASAKSLANYRGTLSRLCDAFPHADPRTIETGELRVWLAKEWGAVEASTRKVVISHVRSYFAWLAEEYETPDPAARIRRPRSGSPRVARLSAEDTVRMLAAARQDGVDERARRIVELVVGAGPRLAEFQALVWRDVDFGRDPAVIHLRGKGNKARVVPLGDELAAFLLERRAGDDDHVIPGTGRGTRRLDPTRRVSQQTADRLVRSVAIAARVHQAEHVTPHVLRAAFADAFLRAYPGHVEYLQALLGHASLATTQRYVQRVRLDQLAPLMRTFTPGLDAPARTDLVLEPEIPAMGEVGFEPTDGSASASEQTDSNASGACDTPDGAS